MKVSVTEHENKCIPPLSSAAVLLISKMTDCSYISHHFKALIHTEDLGAHSRLLLQQVAYFNEA